MSRVPHVTGFKILCGFLSLLLLVLLPILLEPVGGAFLTRMAVIGFLYVTSAVAWDLMGGLVGQVSFGHAAFFGIGAYVSALLVRMGVSGTVSLIPGAVIVSLYAVFWGWPCLRLRGPFFAIATIGVGEATRVIALNWESVSGGATGLTLPISGTQDHTPYYLSLVLAGLAVFVAHVVRGSKLGLGLSCIREDIDAAESIGVPVGWLQLQALVLSAALIGAAGGIYAQYLYYVSPGDVFSFDRSVGFILMSVIGGMNTLWGPVLGGALFLVLERALEISVPDLHLGIYGLLLVLIILFEPRGLIAVLPRMKPKASRGAAV